MIRLKAGKDNSYFWHRLRSRLLRRKWMVLVFLGAVCVIGSKFARQQPTFEAVASVSARPLAEVPSSHDNSLAWYPLSDSSSSSKRRIFPYSVIPGGVSTPEELQRVAAQDPVVSQHFSGFNFAGAHLVRLSEKESKYVSYRIGNRVYWTRRKVSMYPGETLISDGSIVARTRCGNRVASTPLDAGSPLEPSLDALEAPPIRLDPGLPPDPPLTPAVAKLSEIPAGEQKAGHYWFIPPVYVPPGSSGPLPTRLAVTPEPGSVLLICSGMVGVYWRFRKTKTKD